MVEYDLCSAAILGRARLPTLKGQRVNLSCGEDDRMYVNGKAASQTDILASNGIVHVLDDVLIPDSGLKRKASGSGWESGHGDSEMSTWPVLKQNPLRDYEQKNRRA